MPSTLKARLASSQATEGADRSAAGTTAVARYFELLRRAVSDTNWTYDGLAVALNEAMPGRSFDKTYVWRMFNQEKPLPHEVLVALPDDLEARFSLLRAESFGLIVVQPLTGEDARRALVAGLIGVLSTPQLPAKTSGPIRAELRTDHKKAEAV